MYYRTQLLLLNRNCKRVSEFIFDIVQYQRCDQDTRLFSRTIIFLLYNCSYKVSHLYKHTHLSPIGVWLVSSTVTDTRVDNHNYTITRKTRQQCQNASKIAIP